MTENGMPRNGLIYNGAAIRERREELNLTDMWRAAGKPPNKRPVDWLEHAGAEFVAFVQDSLKVDAVHVDRGGRDPATWAHWQVGLAFAKYLDHAFHAWCNTVVRARMEGRSAPAPIRRLPSGVAADSRTIDIFMRVLGFDKNQRALAVNRGIRNLHGVDMLEVIGLTHLIAPQQEQHMTPTEIGVALGKRRGQAFSAQAANKLMESFGFQAKDAATNAWTNTDRGQPYAVWLDTGKKHGSGTPVRQLKWAAGIVDALSSAMDGGASEAAA